MYFHLDCFEFCFIDMSIPNTKPHTHFYINALELSKLTFHTGVYICSIFTFVVFIDISITHDFHCVPTLMDCDIE